MTIDRHARINEAERLARLKATWQANQPSEAEILRARTRWVVALARPRTARTLPRALAVFAILFSGAGALAATGALDWTEPSLKSATPMLSVPNAQPSANATPPAGRSLRPPARAMLPSSAMLPSGPVLRSSAVPPPAAHTAMPSTAAMPNTAGVASAATVPRAEAPITPRAHAPAVPRERTLGAARRAASPPPPEPPATSAGAWQRAAEALRRGDDRQAALALQELTTSSDPYTRDSAALTQAQLDAARGRWDRARPVLLRIAAQGATPLLQQRAREVLARSPN